VGWVVLTTLGRSRNLHSLPADRAALSKQQQSDIISTIAAIWRCVIGVGAAPALLAIIFRLTIPESPRYTIDVVQDGERAVSDIRRYHHVDYSLPTLRADIGIL